MKLSAVLLAGGESHRLGCDKPTVVFQGQPLWRRQLDLLESLSPAEIMVSARTDPSWRPPNVIFVADAPPSRGPLGGLVAALAHTTGTHLLALAVDMPFMTNAHLEAMCGLARVGCGVLPRIGDRAEPLAAIYVRKSLIHLSDSLEHGELSLQRVTEKLVRARMLAVFRVGSPEEKLYQSINHPTDLTGAATIATPYSSLEEATSLLDKG